MPQGGDQGDPSLGADPFGSADYNSPNAQGVKGRLGTRGLWGKRTNAGHREGSAASEPRK